MKTREEVEALKKEWEHDPCWDIEGTEGFEEYYSELLEYRINFWKSPETYTEPEPVNYKEVVLLWFKRIALTSFLGYILWAGFYIRIGVFEFITFGFKFHLERKK